VQSGITDHYDIDDISLNPAYAGKPPKGPNPDIIAAVMMIFVFHHAVSRQDVPKDGDYIII
jgi:hypothetical protein